MNFIKTAVVVFVMMLSLCVVSYAGQTNEEQFLQKLEIIDSDIMEKEYITRAEFAHMTVSFMNIDALPESSGAFADVDAHTMYSDDIAVLYDMGYVKGSGNSLFSPDEPIMTAHAAKMLVSALGFHDICSVRNDFDIKAQSLGLYDGIDSGTRLSGEACVTLLCNALESDVLKIKTYGDSVTYSPGEDGDALYEYFDILTVEGVVTAADGASLTGKSASSDDKIVVDSGYYNLTEDSSYLSLLGYNAKVYVNSKTSDVVFAYEYDNGIREFKIDELDKSKTTLRKISTCDKSYSLSDDVDYVYNGNGYFEITVDELLNGYGTVTLIDNNKNGSYDVVKVHDYISCAVSVADYDSLTLTDFYGNLIPSLEDVESVDVIKNGKKAFFGDIAQNDVALVAIDKTGKFAVVMVSDASVSGVVSEFGDGKIQIEGNFYEVSDSLKNVAGINEKLSPGKDVELRLDAFGRIGYVRFSDDENLKYGYLMAISTEGGLSDLCKLKILADNGQIVELESIGSLRLNDEKATKDALKNAFTSYGEFEQQLIKYATDTNGRVTRLYSQSGGAISMDFPYLQRAQADSGLRVFASDGDFVYNANTVIFSVPMYPELAIDEDYTIASQAKGEYKTSQIAAFDVNEYQIASAIVRKNAATSNNGTVSNDDKNYNPLLVVDKITKAFNSKGDEEYILYCFTKTGDAKYFVSEDKYHLVSGLKEGDVILLRYNQATDHVIDVYKNICDAVNSRTYTHVDEIVSSSDGSRWFEWIYGKVYTRFGDTIKISDKPDPTSPPDYRIYPAGTAKVIVVEKDGVRYGSLADVIPGKDIVLRSRGASVQEIIVYE